MSFCLYFYNKNWFYLKQLTRKSLLKSRFLEGIKVDSVYFKQKLTEMMIVYHEIVEKIRESNLPDGRKEGRKEKEKLNQGTQPRSHYRNNSINFGTCDQCRPTLQP